MEIAAQICPVQFCGHILDQVQRGADPPEHHICFRIETYQRIRKKQKMIAECVERHNKFVLIFRLGRCIELSPVRADAKEHEINELPLDLRKCDNVLRLCDEPQSPLFTTILLKIHNFHPVFGFAGACHPSRVATCSMKLFCQVPAALSKRRITKQSQISQLRSSLGIAFTKVLNNAKISPVNRLILIIICLFTTSAASGQQRPLITDDVDITPQGSLEISAGADFLQNVKFPLSGLKGDLTRIGDIRIRTGFSSNVELQIEGTVHNFLAINSQVTPAPIPLNISGNSTNDFDDITVSAKVKLLNETRALPALGLKFGFSMPNSDQARGIGTNQINIFSKAIVQKRFGKRPGQSPFANIYGNLGLGIMSAPLAQFTQNDVLLYGLAGIFRVTERVNVVSEVNGRVSTRSGPAPLGTESVGNFRIGTQIRASGLRFDTAAIFGLTKFSPRSGLTFGVTYQSPVFLPVAK